MLERITGAPYKAASVFTLAIVCALLCSQTAVAQGSGSATLQWTPPTTYDDDTTPLVIAGYRIYDQDPATGALIMIDDVLNGGISSYVVSGLYNGDHCFVVTAYDPGGLESLPSNTACKTIDEGIGNTPPPPANVIPNAPTNLIVQ